MDNRYITGIEIPDYDEAITALLETTFPDNDGPENWLSGGLDDYRIGIENRDGQIYRVFGVSLNEGFTLHSHLHDLGLRNQVGELEGSRNGYHWLMHPPAES